jgi:hypothetical protein
MGQMQTASSKAESYTWGIEIECFLPQSKVQELGISVGSCPAVDFLPNRRGAGAALLPHTQSCDRAPAVERIARAAWAQPARAGRSAALGRRLPTAASFRT